MSEQLQPFKMNSIAFTISREQAIVEGLAKPTPAEVEAYNADARARWEKSVDEWAEADRFRTALDAAIDPVARAVLDLHKPVDSDTAECDHCTSGEYGDHDQWPCDTVDAVAHALDLEPPAAWLGHRPGPEPHQMPPEGYTPFVPPLRRWITSLFGDAIDSTALHGED